MNCISEMSWSLVFYHFECEHYGFTVGISELNSHCSTKNALYKCQHVRIVCNSDIGNHYVCTGVTTGIHGLITVDDTVPLSCGTTGLFHETY